MKHALAVVLGLPLVLLGILSAGLFLLFTFLMVVEPDSASDYVGGWAGPAVLLVVSVLLIGGGVLVLRAGFRSGKPVSGPSAD
jgi:hypothetical protein